ncbi:unnamed protein product [Spirodela intermedia]|uniref:Uncharacterized protein n=1 Tax=Spirodela intermedia TaxID=51605 RepID=A0A7I8KFX8_SPIIN|nr:unnamed protein product [Spirodela intermedia]
MTRTNREMVQIFLPSRL